MLLTSHQQLDLKILYLFVKNHLLPANTTSLLLQLCPQQKFPLLVSYQN